MHTASAELSYPIYLFQTGAGQSLTENVRVLPPNRTFQVLLEKSGRLSEPKSSGTNLH